MAVRVSNVWEFLDKSLNRLPGWPSERQWVTIGLFGLTLAMLMMAKQDKSLWDVEVFKVLVQAFGITGVLNLVAGFFFSANKENEQTQHNTSKAFEAITAAANAGTASDPDAIKEGDEVVLEKK